MITDYHVEVEKVPSQPGCWDVLNVKILKQNQQIGFYQRNYSSFFQTFCPFEQDGKEYALYSKDYTGTRVMSLPDCVDICGEERDAYGFCPTEYYVPQESKGKYGFVSGCVWGDDSGGDKLQFLDLSQINKGIFKREEKFGYIELANCSLKECIQIDDTDEDIGVVYINVSEQEHYRLDDTPENISWRKIWERLPVGDQMLKLMDYLEKRYCKKCGFYLNKRTYFMQKVNEDGSKEMVEKEFENDEGACRCKLSITHPPKGSGLVNHRSLLHTGFPCRIHMKFEEFLQKVDNTFMANQAAGSNGKISAANQWRYGQTIMNVLWDIWPEKYNELTDSDCDCFYNNSKVDAALEKLQKEWHE